jgi:hypothetical protein
MTPAIIFSTSIQKKNINGVSESRESVVHVGPDVFG